jgi:hypothetical protein
VTRILLTGAGFSRNWGGMLATEVFQYLLGCGDLDLEVRRVLLRDRSFEDVLAALQRATDADGKRRYDQLTSVLAGMFNEMGLAFMQREFEFRNPPDTRYSLANFLMRFDAIFTLNQDTLLEQKYIPFVGPPKWGRAHLPGMKYLGNPQAHWFGSRPDSTHGAKPGGLPAGSRCAALHQASRVNELE